MKQLIVLVTVLFLAACAANPIVIKRIQFNETEFRSLAKSGTATVTGQAFISTADGKKHYAQNEQARLNPKTSYSQQWYEVNYVNKMNIAVADPRYLDYVYKADVDVEGRFIFHNIPAGEYYISAPIFWMKEIKLEDGSILLKRLGSFVCYEVRVEENESMVVNITPEKPFSIVSLL